MTSDSSYKTAGYREETAAKRQNLLLAVGGILALTAAMGIGRFIYTPILPFMEEGLDLSKAEAGWVASSNFLGYLLGALFAALGRLPGSDRSWLLLGLGGSAVTTLAMGLSDSLYIFILLRLLGGIASAFVLVFLSTLVVQRLASSGSSFLANSHFMGVGLGILVSALLVPALDALGYLWDDFWIAAGVFALLVFAMVTFLVPSDRKTISRTASTAPQSEKVPGLGISAIVVAYGLFGFGYVITATFISTMARDLPELQAYEAWVWLVFGLVGIPSVLFWNWIASRYGNGPAYALACLTQALGVVVGVLVIAPWAILTSAGLVGGTIMGITALGFIYARSLSRAAPRRVMALMTASFGLGQILGPLYAGYVFQWTGSFLLPNLTAGAFLLIAALLSFWTVRRNQARGL